MVKMSAWNWLTALVFCAGITAPVYGHPGGLDSNGGHYNRKTGAYHYHRRASTPPAAAVRDNVVKPVPPPVPVAKPANDAPAWTWMVLDVPADAAEQQWRDALAVKVGGIVETRMDGGRADVSTSKVVCEVDRVGTWKQGMGQVLVYARETGKTPVLALISYGRGHAQLSGSARAVIDLAHTECRRNGVKLCVLFSMHAKTASTEW